MDRKRRILLHPGFHRTGAASVGAMLGANRDRLAPHLGLLTEPQLRPAADLCADFSTDRHPLRLADLADTLDAILSGTGLHPVLNDTRDIVLSSSALCGHLPGTVAVPDYGAVPTIAAYLAGYLTERFPDAEVTLVFTTRTPRDWLASIWRAQLQQHRLTQDWPEFSAAFARSANLDHAVMNIAHTIAPASVYTLPLEEAAQHSHGPGGALLELLDLPDDVRSTLVSAPGAGSGIDAALAATLLELNRSDLPKKILVDEKALLVRAAEDRRRAKGD